MGETREVRLHVGLRLARIVTATLAGLFFFIVLVQVAFFPNIMITFNTGTDAQQLSAISIKKGTDVELPTPLKPGSCFLGWSLSPTSGEILKDSKSLLKNTTLYAVWDGAEKYAVLSVNGMTYKEVNIFETRADGLTPTQLTENWRVLDDYTSDQADCIEVSGIRVNPHNNFTRFLGWQYLNNYGLYNDLLYEADVNGTGGTWTLVERNANGNETKTEISEANKFYPPNYRTTFTALLEYRTMHLRFFHEDDNLSYDVLSGKKFGEQITLPVYNNPDKPNAHFSHWEIQVGSLKEHYGSQNPELAASLNQIKTRYESGEVLDTTNPLWYYLGTGLVPLSTTSSELVVTLELRAVHWNNTTVHQYSLRPFTDLDSGTQYIDFSNVSYSDLSLENPVSCEESSIWLYYHPQILSYSFYDHNGVYHEIKTANLKDLNEGIAIGVETTFLGEKIYFNPNWAITISVNYQSSAENITVKFNYGADIYSLPAYNYYERPVVSSYTRKIGNSFVLLTGENYMKTDYIFTGWRLVGDDSGRVYCAGDWFTIPNFNTSNQSTVFEFEAVWYLQRLLFNFDFNGGSWENNTQPNFNSMKGAYGSQVRVVTDVPVRFGYDFVGWSLENNSYTDESELLQPGDAISVGAKLQTLYAQWTPRRLRVLFYTKNNNGQWVPASDPVSNKNTMEPLRSGDDIEMPYLSNTTWYNFNGWQIGGNGEVVAGNSVLTLTTDILSQLQTSEKKDPYTGESILEVSFYADVKKLTVSAIYDLEITTNGSDKVLINGIATDKLITELPQDDYFYDYYPFSVAKTNGSYSIFDTNGRRFIGWHYTIDGVNYEPIDATTKIPVGAKKITVSASLDQVKSISVEYYDFSGNKLDYEISSKEYSYPATIPLIEEEDLSLPWYDDRWGTFVGWALEPDDLVGNPSIIYDVHYNTENPRLELSNQDNTSVSPYLINIDRYAEQVSDNNYVLKLYAVYSSDYIEVTYYPAYDNDSSEVKRDFKFPVYSNGQYEKTVLGGSTVGFDSDDYAEYGIAVLDDTLLGTITKSENFIGWRAILPDGVNPTTRNYFQNKIWLPGEFLPSIDFNIEFEPVRCDQSSTVQEISVGTTTYRVLSVANDKIRNGVINVNFNGNVDLVALPRGSYTIKEGNIKITSENEVHLIIPANKDSNIVIEPRAIQSDAIKEFYVGENLIVSGSPVVGANFQAYRIQKGYRIIEEGNPTGILAASEKYDYQSSLLGLLVSKDCKTLYGVPSHVSLTADELFDYLNTIGINHINSYAFSDMNNMPNINLGFNLAADQIFEIEANAIFNGTVVRIILPASDGSDLNIISPQVLGGALRNLKTVTFGDTETANTGYAFVEDGFVYYIDNPAQTTAKTHVMYVLPTAKLEALEYTTRNLRFADTVSIIEPYALMGRDWTQINSVMAENNQLNVSELQGIPSYIPIFISAENLYKDDYTNPMIQTYKKNFIFVCYGGTGDYNQKELEFSYGQTFTVFNAQQNNYNIIFNKAWCQFVCWKMNGDYYNVGKAYKVGISDELKGDQFIFDASGSDCWVNYPVQFYIYNGKNNEAYEPSAFYDNKGNKYSISKLLTYSNNLGQIYLPGLDHKFTGTDGSVYQFIGWSINQTIPSTFNSLLWNNTNVEYRILPNRTRNTVLNSGYLTRDGESDVYKYYALYEKVTPDMQYELLENQTFAVEGPIQTTATSLNIPFANYHDGYMLPISKIKNNGFKDRNFTEITIGAAVSEIGDYAFSGVNAEQITFAHKGLDINYNYQSASLKLTIGKNAFAGNRAVQKIILPAALKTINDYAFYSCTKLVNVSFEREVVSLSNIGNFVFQDNISMTDNAVIRLLINDSSSIGKFTKVGDGIFRNTNISNVRTSDGKSTNKIVWRGKLLHVYYPTGFAATELVFDENEIAGYAFVDAGNDDVKITLRFTNPDVIINAKAFSMLHTSVNKIYLKEDNKTSVKIENVHVDAFDSTIDHQVSVYTNNYITWGEKFQAVTSFGKVMFLNA